MVKVACLCDTGLEVAKNTAWAVSSVGRASALQAVFFATSKPVSQRHATFTI